MPGSNSEPLKWNDFLWSYQQDLELWFQMEWKLSMGKDLFGFETPFPEVCRFASCSFTLSFTQRWVSGVWGHDWRNLYPHTCPLFPVSKFMPKDGAEKLAEGTSGRGEMRETKWIMNLKIANYLVSYSSEPWHNDEPQSRFFSLNGFTFKQAN